jgi:hypothetical protein
MRCVACNKNLSDFESTRKDATTGKYLDMCSRCFSDIASDFLVVERTDLVDTEVSDWDDEPVDTDNQYGE